MDFDADTWLLVLNPVSGRGAGMRDRRQIEEALAAHGLHHRVAVSEYAGHTIALVKHAVEAGCRRVLVAGGDGSLSEAANGILAQATVAPVQVALALIPIGTGNDWARLRGVPRGYGDAAAIAAAGGRRHFVNVAGVGFDAGVVERMPTRRLGRLAYLIGLLRELVAYRPLPLRWRSGDAAAAADAFVMFACIGRYCGGGMHVAPAARDDDGLLDIALIRHMSRLEVMRSLPHLFDGTIAGHPKVAAWQTASIELEGPAGATMEADGELAGHLPAVLRVERNALRVVVPQQIERM